MKEPISHQSTVLESIQGLGLIHFQLQTYFTEFKVRTNRVFPPLQRQHHALLMATEQGARVAYVGYYHIPMWKH